MSDDGLLKPGEVAEILKVSPHTVTRWAALGIIPCIQAHPTAHRRFRREDVDKLLRARGD